MITLLGIGRAAVVEQLVVAAGQLADLVHVLLDDVGNGVIVLVGSLAALEEDVRVLRGAAADAGCSGFSARARKALHGVPVHQRGQISS